MCAYAAPPTVVPSVLGLDVSAEQGGTTTLNLAGGTPPYTVAISPLNDTVLPTSSINIDGNGTVRTLTVTPASAGSSMLIIVVTDAKGVIRSATMNVIAGPSGMHFHFQIWLSFAIR